MHLYSFYDKVSRIALAFPAAYEKPCHRTPGFYIGTKLFARIREDGETLAVYNNDRDKWIASDGEVFFFTEHYKNHPMLLINLAIVSKKDLEELMRISYAARSGKKTKK